MCNIQLRENDARACGMMSHNTTWNLLLIDTVDAVVSGHPRDAKKVSDHLREYKDIEFVLELTKTGFCEGRLKYKAVRSAYESVHKES